MTDFIETYTIDFNNIEVIYQEVESDWDELICENDGYFTSFDQCITFDSNGSKFSVIFNFSVEGTISYDGGDYYTPPYSEIIISDIGVDIKSILIDGYFEIELDIETLKILENKIKDIIK